MLQRIREGQIRNLRDAREAGFTLIELLIVIVVLGVLAGIVVFGVSTFKKDSEEAACKADVKTVGVASDAFKAKSPTSAYPTAITDLTAGANPYLKAAPKTTIAFGASTVSSDCNADGDSADAGESA